MADRFLSRLDKRRRVDSSIDSISADLLYQASQRYSEILVKNASSNSGDKISTDEYLPAGESDMTNTWDGAQDLDNEFHRKEEEFGENQKLDLIDDLHQSNCNSSSSEPEPGQVDSVVSSMLQCSISWPDWISDYISVGESSTQSDFQRPRDFDLPFDKHSNPEYTKGQAANDLHELCGRHGIKQVVIDDLLDFFDQHTQSLNLPIITRKSSIFLASENNNNTSKNNTDTPARNSIKQYVEPDDRSIVFDVCPSECMVYHGMQTCPTTGEVINAAELIQCMVCATPRYSHCTHADCQMKEYHQCHPHKSGPGILKNHSVIYRVPLRTVYYRPIIPKLLKMYKKSLTEGNRDLLNYPQTRVKREGYIIDSWDGTEIQKQYNEMIDNFKKAHDFVKATRGETLYQCSLALSMFLDGKVNFKRSLDSMYPLLVSIMNCNPSMRAKLGGGLFLAALHNCKSGSPVETYLLNNIFVEELLRLEKGIVFRFERQLTKTTTELVSVFLQARVVFTHMDTIEYQSFYRVQGSGSCAGCSQCRGVKGIHRDALNKVIYRNSRLPLHTKHALRKFGQNQTATQEQQEDFYNGTGDEVEVNRRVAVAVLENVSAYRPDDPGADHILPIHGQTGDHVFKMWADRQTADVWYNYDFPITDFLLHLYYPMRDTRPQNGYIRVTSEQYVADGTECLATNADHISGVKGVVCLMRLPYFRVEWSVWDIMHVLLNINGHTIKFYKGEHGRDDGTRKLCMALKVHPSMKYKDGQLPCHMSNDDFKLIDGICNTFYVPTGHKDIYNVTYPMSRTGNMKGIDHMKFLMVYAPYLYSFTHLARAHKRYAMRFASDLSRLFNPCMKREELDDLIKSVIETKAIHEGLFYESEQFFVCHELIDIVHHIKSFGHVKGLMCFFGERAMAFISRHCPSGGVHYLKALYHNYVSLENSMSLTADNSINPHFIDNTGQYSDFVMKMLGQYQQYQLSTYHKNCLFECVIAFLNTDEIENKTEKSAMYRVHEVYLHNSTDGVNDNFKAANVEGFVEWLGQLYDTFVMVSGQIDLDSRYGQAYLKEHVKHLVMGVNGDNEGALLMADFSGIIKELVQFSPNVYTTALIKGVHFSCRGVHYAETALPLALSVRVKNPDGSLRQAVKYRNYIAENDVDHSYWKAFQYSSWAMVRNYKAQRNNMASRWEVRESKPQLGQLNYVFRLNLPSDALLHGLAFGNLSFHKSTVDVSRANQRFVKAQSLSFDASKNFACLHYVDSTGFLVSALDENDLPIFKAETFSGNNSSKTSGKVLLSNTGVLHKLYLIAMHPERMFYQYGNLGDDLEHTKVFEKENT